MEIEGHFFSDKNTYNLFSQLCEQLGATNKKSKKSCKVLLDDQMGMVFNKNRSKISKGNPTKMLGALNSKTFEQCIKRFKE